MPRAARTTSIAALGWMIYGLGAKAVSGIVFLIGPLILIDAARKAEEVASEEGELDDDLGLGLPRVLPTSLPSLTITVALFAQCVAAPLLASAADVYGTRRMLMAGHVAAGLLCTVLLGLSSPTTPVLYQAVLVGAIYYTMAIAWMFQNSLLPSVASVHRRPALSLASTALSNLGGAAFLIVQHQLLSSSSGSSGGERSGGVRAQPSPPPPAPIALLEAAARSGGRAGAGPIEGGAPLVPLPLHLPVGSAHSAVVAAAASHAPDTWHAPPTTDALHLVCLVGAAWWFLSAVPALLCMATLPAEPLPAEAALAEESGAPTENGGGDGDDDDDEVREAAAVVRQARVHRVGLPPAATHGADESADDGVRRALPPASLASASASRPGASSVSFFAGLRRMRRHKHASRFVVSQVLYLTASTADGTSASAFAQEVVGLDVTAIVRLTMYAAFAGAAGSICTMGLARCFGARTTLCCLMALPPLLLIYSSCILVSEYEFLLVGMVHAFVSGGVGFHGLNRGVFAQMVPTGREAEFFGVYFVSIKACSWMGPLLCALLNELTGSLRLAILSALVFYVPAVLCLALTDFEEAKREAEAASLPPRMTPLGLEGAAPSGSAPPSDAKMATATSGAPLAGPHEKLLGGSGAWREAATTYGTC